MAKTVNSTTLLNASKLPDFSKEVQLWQNGCRLVAGVDEAGRGALAGPVVAAAVMVPVLSPHSGVWKEVRDSKLLSPNVRETLEADIQANAQTWAIGQATACEIDSHGIVSATRLAMMRALAGLVEQPEHLLIDWVRLDEAGIPQTCWPKADRSSVSVAAASILAKVHRDRMMRQLATEYPEYGFAEHKGYGTKAHRAALAQIGPCSQHRYSFAPVAQFRGLFDE